MVHTKDGKGKKVTEIVLQTSLLLLPSMSSSWTRTKYGYFLGSAKDREIRTKIFSFKNMKEISIEVSKKFKTERYTS